jgi:predicted glycoside hydrolase/deacetylase ChbG (UPF0249 family)
MTGPDRLRLIIIADDYGYHPSVDAGIAAAVDAGAVTSISIMVPGWNSRSAIRFVGDHPSLDCGLHLMLPESAAYGELTADGITETFVGQCETYRQLFGRKPSNLAFHHTSRLNAAANRLGLKFAVSMALAETERTTGIRLRSNLVRDLGTVTAARSIPETVAAFVDRIAGFGPGPHGMMECAALTNARLLHTIHTDRIELIDFRISGRQRSV